MKANIIQQPRKTRMSAHLSPLWLPFIPSSPHPGTGSPLLYCCVQSAARPGDKCAGDLSSWIGLLPHLIAHSSSSPGVCAKVTFTMRTCLQPQPAALTRHPLPGLLLWLPCAQAFFSSGFVSLTVRMYIYWLHSSSPIAFIIAILSYKPHAYITQSQWTLI